MGHFLLEVFAPHPHPPTGTVHPREILETLQVGPPLATTSFSARSKLITMPVARELDRPESEISSIGFHSLQNLRERSFWENEIKSTDGYQKSLFEKSTFRKLLTTTDYFQTASKIKYL